MKKDTLWLERDAQGVARDEQGTITEVISNKGSMPQYVQYPSEIWHISGSTQANVLSSPTLPCLLCNKPTKHYKTDLGVHVAICYDHEIPYMWYKENH
jgi:hypothetical protein